MIGAQIATGQWRGQVGLSLTLAFVLMTAACGDGEPGDVPGTTTTEDAGNVPGNCHPVQLQPDGGCCAPGTFLDPGTASCMPFGPPECAAVLPDKPTACVPRWCADWRRADGSACSMDDADCLPVGRPCTDDERAKGAGCDAGDFPAADGTCHAAGAQLAPPAGMPAFTGAKPPPLPAPAPPRWCPNAQGDSGACAKDADGCAAGHEPDPKAAGTCRPLSGVDWICPGGFVIDASTQVAKGALKRCVPDPAACGSDPFGGVQQAKDVYFIDGAAKAPGSGSRLEPWASLAHGVTTAPTGSTLVLANGTYTAGFTIQDKSLVLRGRCAHGVRVQGQGGATTLTFLGAGTAGSALHGLTILGPNKAVAAEKSASLLVERCFVQGARSVGMRTRTGAVLTARDVVVADTDELIKPLSPANMNKFGRALAVEQGSKMILERVRAVGNRDWAVSVVSGSELKATELLVDGTRVEKAGGRLGWGMSILNGSKVILKRARLHRNRGRGIFVEGKGSSLDARHLVVEDTLSTGKLADGSVFGRGVDVQDGGSAIIWLGRLSRNRDTGIIAFGADSTLLARDVLVEDTLPEEKVNYLGRGIDLENIGHVKLERVWLRRNQDTSLFVWGTHTRAEATDLLIEDTLPRADNKKVGRGINLQNQPDLDGQTGPQLTLLRTRVRGSHNTGIFAFGGGVQITATDLVVDGTMKDVGTGEFGRALEMQNGVKLDLRRGWLRNNYETGLQAAGKGTVATLRDVWVGDTLPAGLPGLAGRGMVVRQGAVLTLRGGRVSNSVSAGILVYNGGQMHASDLLVEGTKADAVGDMGRGVESVGKSEATFVGLRLVGNREFGLGVSDASAAIVGGVIEGTLPQVKYDRLGLGVLSEQMNEFKGSVHLQAVILRANHTSGVLIHGGKAVLERVVAIDTLPANMAAASHPERSHKDADGLIIQDADVVATQNVVSSHPRAGILLSDNSSLKLVRASISANTWGIVTQLGGQLTSTSSALWENSFSNTTGELVLGLPKPPAPSQP